MAHAHARHAQCQQGPLSVVPTKHLVQRPDDEREEDHRQALAQRRPRIQIDQPIDAQRIQHARADRRAAAVKDRLCAHIAAQCGKQVDARLKHADACAERHAHIPQNRRNIQEQLRIELRRGIAIAQQRGSMDAHGELPAAQTAGDALDAVQVEQHIVSVKHAAPEQRHAGKRRRAKHHQRIPSAHAPPRTRIPAQNEQHRQHRAEQRRVRRQIGREYPRADLMHRDASNLRAFGRVARDQQSARRICQRKAADRRSCSRRKTPCPILDKGLSPCTHGAKLHVSRRIILNRHIVIAPRQIQPAVFALRRKERLDVVCARSPKSRFRTRLRRLLFFRHGVLIVLLASLGFLAANQNLIQRFFLIAPCIFVPVRVDEHQRGKRQPERRNGRQLFCHNLYPPAESNGHNPP